MKEGLEDEKDYRFYRRKCKWKNTVYKGIGLQTRGWCVRGCIL